MIKDYWDRREKYGNTWQYEEEIARKKEERSQLMRKIVVVAALLFLAGYILYEYYFYHTDEKAKQKQKEMILQYAKENNIEFDEDDYEEYMEVMEKYYENDTSHDYLKQLKISGKKYEFGANIYYYETEEVKTIRHNCDYNHMAQTYEDVSEFLAKEMPQAQLTENEFLNKDNNYSIKYIDGRQYVYFNTSYYAYDENVNVELNVDTSTGKIHSLEFATYEKDEKVYELAHKWLTQYGSDVFTKDYLKEKVEISYDNGIMYFKCEDKYMIKYYASKNSISIEICPEEMKTTYEKGLTESAKYE